MQDLVLANSFILHRSLWREQSYLLDVFSREHGRVRIIARGQRSAKKKLGSFEPFESFRLLARGRGELKSLVGAESTDVPLKLKGSKSYCGLYLNELLKHLLPLQDQAESLFDEYRLALHKLSGPEDPEEIVLRHFERALFQYCGVDIDTRYCAAGEVICQNKHYRWVNDKGWQAVPDAGPGIYSGDFVLRLANGEIMASELKALKQLHRRIIDQLLGGKELYSRQLFVKVGTR